MGKQWHQLLRGGRYGVGAGFAGPHIGAQIGRHVLTSIYHEDLPEEREHLANGNSKSSAALATCASILGGRTGG